MTQLLAVKGTDVWSVSPDTAVFEALQLMADKNIGALVVLEGGRPVGVVSERDYTRKVILKGRASRDTPVRSIMTTEFPVASPASLVDECMGLMTRSRARHVLVMDGAQLQGVVSIGDLVKSTIEHQQFTITQLEQYIST
jgi:CBS domain-containing protein